MVFKFNDYKFKVDADFKDYEFTQMEFLKNKTIVIEFAKFYEETDEDKTRTACRFAYKLDGEEKIRFSYTKSYGIVSVLMNIIEEEGVIPKVPVMITTTMTKSGNMGYIFADIEE